MAKQMRVGVKAAWIGGICLVIAAMIIIVPVFQNIKKAGDVSIIKTIGNYN